MGVCGGHGPGPARAQGPGSARRADRGGDWLGSDAERAAAGRETIAERSRRLLPANRERAARRHADGELPERAGVACAHREWTGGHDTWWWQSQLPEALAWLLAAG